MKIDIGGISQWTWHRHLRAALSTAAITTMAIVPLAGCSSGTEQPPRSAEVTAQNVRLTTAQRQHVHLYTVANSAFRKTIETTGVVDFDNDQATAVLAPISGPVMRTLVSVGEKVTKGQPLAQVDSPDFAVAVSTYNKALVTATNTRRLANVDKDLVQHDGVAKREAEQAATDAASADADLQAARQALLSLNVDAATLRNLSASRSVIRVQGMIRSPIAGTVVEKLITPGQLLQAGSTPCFTVANLSRVWVMAQLFGADLESVHVGDSAIVETGTQVKALAGTVENISALVDPDTRAVSVRVVVENPDDILKKQMYVRVRIHSGKESRGLLIPVSAILRDDENLPFVYVAQTDGGFARRRVSLGYRAGDRYEIPQGLKAGDQVMIDGGLFVQFMQSQ